MNKKILFSVIIIVFAFAASLGATMAWFTAEAEAPENVFMAGTVQISAEESYVLNGEKMGNVNPGDCFVKCFEIENEGSKRVELRLENFVGQWENLDGWGPVHIVPVPGSGWVMESDENNESFTFYYSGGPVEPGETVTLCILVRFDGIEMTDIYQGKTFSLNGIFEAVQTTNNAPVEVWGSSWDSEWFAMSEEAALIAGTSATYAAYFYENGQFKFEPCLESNGNGGGNGNGGSGEGETAYAGDTVGTPPPWWFYMEYSGQETTQNIWAGQNINVGTATISEAVNGEVTITINLNGWVLKNDPEAVKIQGFGSGWSKSWTPPGQLSTDKGNVLIYSDIPEYSYYVIHLDVVEE